MNSYSGLPSRPRSLRPLRNADKAADAAASILHDSPTLSSPHRNSGGFMRWLCLLFVCSFVVRLSPTCTDWALAGQQCNSSGDRESGKWRRGLNASAIQAALTCYILTFYSPEAIIVPHQTSVSETIRKPPLVKA